MDKKSKLKQNMTEPEDDVFKLKAKLTMNVLYALLFLQMKLENLKKPEITDYAKKASALASELASE